MTKNCFANIFFSTEMQSLDTASISSQGSTLSHLVLSKNQLKDVPTRALSSLRELDHLNLNDNQITSLHANAFEGLTKVILFVEVKLIETNIGNSTQNRYNVFIIITIYLLNRISLNLGYKTLHLR